MKKIFTLVFTILVLVVQQNPLFGQNFTNRSTIDQAFCGNSVIVVLNKNAGGINRVPAQTGVFDAIEHVAIRDLTATPDIGTQQTALHNAETFQQILLLEFEQNDKQNVLDIIEQLRFTSGVYYAAPNYFRELTSTLTPNDQRFNDLWGMQNIQAPQAWAITTGSRDVRVGIIDIGFQSHNDLNANLVNGFCFFSNQTLTTANLGTTLPTTHPTRSHGNHVAGTVGAVGNNTIGVVGVNWEVSLIPLEVFTQFNADNAPVTTDARMIQAITWARNNNVPIVNMSLSGFGTATSIRLHIQNNFTGLVTWSAGNSSTNIDNNLSSFGTFDLPNIIGVGAIGPTNQRASYSCFGATSVAIYAPGGDIVTAWEQGILSTVLDNGYGWSQGTSMAAPHVAGVAALLLSVDPTLTGVQLKDLILEGAIPLTVSTPTGNQNTHRLSAFGALEALNDLIGGNAPDTVPFFENFEGLTRPNLPPNWEINTTVPGSGFFVNTWIANAIDIFGNGFAFSGTGTMGVLTGAVGNPPSPSGAANAALWSPDITMTEGNTYQVSFQTRIGIGSGTTVSDVLRVTVHDAVTHSQVAQIFHHTTGQIFNWTLITGIFTPPTTGEYYLQFHVTTPAGIGGGVFIDDVSIVRQVITPIYEIALSQTGTHIFPNAVFGYSAQTPLSVSIENTGNQPTGTLNIALSGTHASSFALSRTTVPSIDTASTNSFTVVPNTGLSVGTYTATVTVTGGNGISENFNVSFTVNRAVGATVGTPTLASKTHNQIIVNPVAPPGNGQTVQYAIHTTNNANPATLVWQNSTTFNGRTPETNYFVYARSVQNANFYAGAPSVSAVITTPPVPTFGIALSQKEMHTFDTAFFGYSTHAQIPLSVTITNTGNQPTGTLNIALSGASPNDFILGRTIIPSIAVAETTNFIVVQDMDLSVGTHSATVTVTGENNISASFDVRFTVISAPPVSIVIVETGRAPSLQVHPNPFTDEIHIVNAEIGQMLYVLNASGIIVHAQRITRQNETIQLGHLPVGTYILRIGEQSIRLVKR